MLRLLGILCIEFLYVTLRLYDQLFKTFLSSKVKMVAICRGTHDWIFNYIYSALVYVPQPITVHL